MQHPVSLILKQKGFHVHTVKPDDNVANAIQMMNDANIGAVLVLDAQAKLVGIFTERDVLRKACFRSHADMKNTRVGELMTENPATGSPKTTIEQAMRLFTNHRFRHLPILEHGKLVGLISSGDVTKWVIESQQDEIDHLADYIQGEHTSLQPHDEDNK